MDRRLYGARGTPGDAYYIRTHYVTDTDFIPFFQRALGTIDRRKRRRLITDWRFNFGGDGSKLQSMAICALCGQRPAAYWSYTILQPVVLRITPTCGPCNDSDRGWCILNERRCAATRGCVEPAGY